MQSQNRQETLPPPSTRQRLRTSIRCLWSQPRSSPSAHQHTAALHFTCTPHTGQRLQVIVCLPMCAAAILCKTAQQNHAAACLERLVNLAGRAVALQRRHKGAQARRQRLGCQELLRSGIRVVRAARHGRHARQRCVRHLRAQHSSRSSQRPASATGLLAHSGHHQHVRLLPKTTETQYKMLPLLPGSAEPSNPAAS